MNNNQHRVVCWGRSWGKAQYYKAAREMAEKAMPHNPPLCFCLASSPLYIALQ